jgi:cation-transporting ATPase E
MNIERYTPDYDKGLTNEQVQERYNHNLVNYDNQPPTKSVKEIITSNFFTYFNFLNMILGLSIIISGIWSGQLLYSLKNCLFMGVIIANSIISIIQEIMAKKTIDKLSLISAAKIETIREGQTQELSINEIVLDDVLKLKAGNQVATDCIILEGTIEVNESFITGESDPIIKKKGDSILSGSFVVSGNCYAKVEHIGSDNYISTISSEAKYTKQVNSVIMDSFNKLLKILSIVIIPIGIILLYNQLQVNGNDIPAGIISTVAALIGMIPEGLVLLTSSVMAVSVIRLSKYQVLVQQLYCIEILARVDVICLDKTGTITEGQMELSNIIEKEKNSNLNTILANIANAFENTNATMSAIKDKYPLTEKYTVIDKIEFSSARKFSAVKFDGRESYYIGAPEFLLEKEVLQNYTEEIEEYQNNYRVLVLASTNEELTETPTNLNVIAFLLIQDKIRASAPDTLKFFKDQGVKIKIISGDNYKTVASIAKRAGLEDAKGIDATTINDQNINNIVEEYDIFGRVTPDQKKQIIKALQAKKHTVAMTGDGVNDVLALKQSDCSIAMASGSEAARNVSQLVLLNSDFSSMPKIVAEGRRTINNIERSSSLLLVKTIFTLLLIFVCIFMKSEYFYVPIQLTLITSCTISIPSFILALEPNTELVKGNFMIKVVGRSLPAALTVVFNVIMIVLFEQQLGIDSNLTQTLIVIMTATTGFIYLFRICKPYTPIRVCLLAVLLAVFFYGIMFQYDFFDLHQVTFKTILLYIVFYICSIHIFDKLNNLIGKLLNKIEEKYY